MFDGRAGLVPEDRDVMQIVQSSAKPCVLIVNKIDKAADDEMAKAEFFEFGYDVLGAAFEARRGVGDLLQWLSDNLEMVEWEEEEERDEAAPLRVAIVGKPNVGKSSLINQLIGEDRVMVSDVAGTTIDQVDVPFKIGDRDFILYDTAGLRRQSRRHEDLERISAVMTEKALKGADLILLTVDVREGPSDQDARILQDILESHKGVLLVANKTDLAQEEIPEFRKRFREIVAERFHFFKDIQVCYTSAMTTSGLEKLTDQVVIMSDRLKTRIKTRDLNDFFSETIRKTPAPLFGTKTVKFYYLTQTKQMPPSFIVFANHPKGVNPSYRRFLINQLRARFDLEGIPIRIFVMGKDKSKDKNARR